MGASINGFNVTSVEVFEPLYGVWMADVEADSLSDISGSVTLDIEGVSFVGSVVRGNVESGHWEGRIVAGAGGLGTVLDSKQYISVSVGGLIGDLCRGAGETLDETNSDSATLDRVLPKWHRSAASAGASLRMLMSELSATFRMSRAGQLVVAADTFPEVEIEDAILVDAQPGLGIRIVAPKEPTLRPGITYDGSSISYVVTRATSDSLRQELWSA